MMKTVAGTNFENSPQSLRHIADKNDDNSHDDSDIKSFIAKRPRFGDLVYFDESSQSTFPSPSAESRSTSYNDLSDKIKSAIDRQREFRKLVKPTLDNLALHIDIGNDAEAADLLKSGARLDSSPRSLGILLDLFESSDMPMTTTYLVKNHLVPSNVGLEHFVASLESGNAELSYYLSEMPSIREALAELDNDTRRLYRYTYSFNMLQWMLKNALEQAAFRKFQSLFNMSALSDVEFIALVRQGKIMKWASDEQIVVMRNNAAYNPYSIVGDLRTLFHWSKTRPADEKQFNQFGFELDSLFRRFLQTSNDCKALRAIFLVPSLTIECICAA